MKNKKRKNKPEPSIGGALKFSLYGVITFIISALITSLAAALIAYSTQDPGSSLFPLGLAALYISALAGGFAAYKCHRGLALITGLFCGLACIAVSLLISLFMPAGDFSPLTVFLSRLPILPCSAVGAAIASVKPRKKRRKRG